MLIDSHTHLYLNDFQPNQAEAVQRAIDKGIGRLMFPNVDLSTIEPMNMLAKQFPNNVDMAIGLHPTEVNENWNEALKTIESELATGVYRAIGEIGIDLYWDSTYRDSQKSAFYEQCLMACNNDLPVIIHCREGLTDTIEVISMLPRPLPSAVFHSFGGSIDDVRRIREIGDFYFGINGIVTFKNSKLREVLPYIGLDRILLETDSPYLAPVPMRGKRNESSYLIHIANYVSQALNISINDVETKTTENYFKFLGVHNS